MKVLIRIVSYLINFNFLKNLFFQYNLMRNAIPTHYF
jgi:hypothetical protein